MQKILWRLAFPFLACALLAGCMATGEGVDPEAPIVPLVDVAKRKAELAALQPLERLEWCFVTGTNVGRLPTLKREARISGPLLYQQSNAQKAGNTLLDHIESYYFGGDFALSDIRETLKEGARIEAFTVLLPYHAPELPDYNPMNEAVFQVANFMVPLAHAYLILKEEYPEDAALLAAVKRWGNRLFEATRNANDDFLGVAKGVDRRALIAAGWASWGNVANNRPALAHAYRYYMHALASIGRGGADQFWLHQARIGDAGDRLFFSTVTVAAALVAGHALHRSGAGDVYTVAPGGGTIVEGAAWLWNRLQEEQPSNLLQARYSGSEGVGWAELFLHEFPEHPLIADIDAGIDVKRPLYLNMGGGPTTCLYRRVTPVS